MESTITIELTGRRLVRKPLGSKTLLPWSAIDHDGEPIGELWFQRTDPKAPDPALLLKLLFVNEKLSIQVHPDDEYAQSIGLPRGKTEAWYIVSATADAQVVGGLKRHLTTQQFQTSIEDGSISDQVEWHQIHAGDVVFVPAGTIHAIGPGLVIAEVQQNSDAIFRLFDYDRHRELHVADAVAMAVAGPAGVQVAPRRVTDARTLLVACPYFVLERIDLAPGSRWQLDAAGETWLLVLDGDAKVGTTDATAGTAVFLEADRVTIETGRGGLSGLVAYVATEPWSGLLTTRPQKLSMEART
jgi:mannose-6-phosphate isomerase